MVPNGGETRCYYFISLIRSLGRIPFLFKNGWNSSDLYFVLGPSRTSSHADHGTPMIRMCTGRMVGLLVRFLSKIFYAAFNYPTQFVYF